MNVFSRFWYPSFSNINNAFVHFSQNNFISLRKRALHQKWDVQVTLRINWELFVTLPYCTKASCKVPTKALESVIVLLWSIIFVMMVDSPSKSAPSWNPIYESGVFSHRRKKVKEDWDEDFIKSSALSSLRHYIS